MTRARFAPLIGSLWVAAMFIAVRVFWRLVSGTPSWSGTADAVTAALPFAILIVSCGLLSSFINVRRAALALARFPIGRSIATALAIGLASVTELAETARTVRDAQAFRGARSTRLFVIPLLEHALERALALAAALEVRGVGQPRSVLGHDGRVVFERVSVHFGERCVLDEITVTLPSGSLTVITGPTGSGKTTLLETVVGLTEQFHGGVRNGTVTVAGIDRRAPIADTAAAIGYLPQHVHLGFLGETVADELAFTARLRGASAPAPAINTPQRIGTLSAGERVRLALDSALLGAPRILVLDEPFADLDAAQREALVERIGHLRESGVTILIAEHHTDAIARLQPRWLQLEHGHLRAGRWAAHAHTPPRSPARVGVDVVVELAVREFAYCGQIQPIQLDATLRAGAIVALTGPNGSGKTSLLRSMARPTAGAVRAHGVDACGPRPNPHLVAFVPHDVRPLFVCETLAEELQAADRIAGVPRGLTETTFRSIVTGLNVDALLHTHPRDLSAGTQRALALAAQLSHKPALLLIDEPTRGLDPQSRADMAETLRCVSETGTAVVFASHDESWSTALADHRWSIERGVLNHPERTVHTQ